MSPLVSSFDVVRQIPNTFDYRLRLVMRNALCGAHAVNNRCRQGQVRREARSARRNSNAQTRAGQDFVLNRNGSTKLAEGEGFVLSGPILQSQLIDSTNRQNSQKRQKRRTEVHGGYTA